MIGKIAAWLEDRTGAVGAARQFLNEQVPASTGWRNTLGSVAGALLLVQILSGFLLMLYYVPHPDAAFVSIKWMAENITLGGFVRALHYWGASFIVVALFAHVLRVFLSGAYRKPREATWLVGIGLLALVATLAFTGQLLPYDQMGYWAATVGVEIASSAPVIGDSIRTLLLGGDTVGALTLTRFYALHVVLLPMLLALLVGAHLYLLRKHGPARAANETTGATTPFFPVPFLRDMVVISGALVLLGGVAAIYGGPHAGPVDLDNTSYTPKPEWYFYAHYELLKLTQGEFQKVLVAFVLPNLVLGGMVLLPWIDRAPSNALSARKPVVAAGLLLAFSIVGLTLYGVAANREPGPAESALGPSPIDDPIQAKIAAGRVVFEEELCAVCHDVNNTGRSRGPDLRYTGLRLRESYLREWLRDPEQFKADTIMPAVTAEGEDFENLVLYLLSMDEVPESL